VKRVFLITICRDKGETATLVRKAEEEGETQKDTIIWKSKDSSTRDEISIVEEALNKIEKENVAIVSIAQTDKSALGGIETTKYVIVAKYVPPAFPGAPPRRR
jgi:hypothetical protein